MFGENSRIHIIINNIFLSHQIFQSNNSYSHLFICSSFALVLGGNDHLLLNGNVYTIGFLLYIVPRPSCYCLCLWRISNYVGLVDRSYLFYGYDGSFRRIPLRTTRNGRYPYPTIIRIGSYLQLEGYKLTINQVIASDLFGC